MLMSKTCLFRIRGGADSIPITTSMLLLNCLALLVPVFNVFYLLWLIHFFILLALLSSEQGRNSYVRLQAAVHSAVHRVRSQNFSTAPRVQQNLSPIEVAFRLAMLTTISPVVVVLLIP